MGSLRADAVGAQAAAMARADLEGTVGERFAAVAALCPDAPALVSDGRSWSYAALNRAANALAWRLLAELGDGEIPVILEPAPDPWMLVGVLAACKAGKPFTALAEGLGDELKAALVRELRPGLTLDAAVIQQVGAIEQVGREDRNPPTAFGPERAVSIVYTSGSTARPKGVVRTHGNLLHRAWIYRGHSGVGPGDVQALMAPLSHVGAESDLFGAWLNGATVSRYPASRGVGGVARWLVEDRVALWHPPVGLLRRFLGLLEEPLDPPALRLVALGGETIYWSDVRALRAKLGAGIAVLHRYSSSEAGNIAALEARAELGPNSAVVPAGFPCDDKQVRISEQGEAIVSSRYLARGYWGGPDFGEEYATGDLGRFDAEGRLHLLGRKDRRVKVRGYLVDLAEVEGVILAEPGVAEAAVIAAGDRLLAYVVRPPQGLEARVAAKLAPWMRPDAYVALDEMPLTATGKVDRRSLPEPAARGAAPAAGLEHQLTALWRSVLERDDLGADDDFFALGGDSLRAGELAVRISRLVEREVPVSALFWAPTPRAMSQAVTDGAIHEGGLAPLADGEGEPWLLLPPPPEATTWYRDLPKALRGPVYGFHVRWTQTEIHAVAAKIASELDARWPRRRFSLAGYSFGGNLAFEAARLLDDRVSAVVLIDSHAPGFVTGREIDHGVVGNRLAVYRHTLNCWRFEARTWRRLQGKARREWARSYGAELRNRLDWRFILRKALVEKPAPRAALGVRHHDTGRYAGRTHVVRFSHPYPGTPADPYLGWGRWAEGPLTAETIPGIHLPLMFQAPWAEPLARALERGRGDAA
ncbi:MAG: AMP-binding protein [Acidobacteria bacterium]|nr:AMP-binding protein [Acidobacteriota bacterium]